MSKPRMTSGAATTVGADAIAALRQRLRGQVLEPADPGYDEARRLWNAYIDRRPALVARCTDRADVVIAMRFARDQRLPVAVRAGGHGVAGHAVCDDGLLIDLSLMHAVAVEPAARRVRVEGGATWADVDQATQAFGLATPGGIVSTTGVGGLTLGGGLGWLGRLHGLSADNLLSADVVTAEGFFAAASPEQNPDLFWALRGGGGNFGIVTSFELALHDVGPTVLFGPTLHRLEDAPGVLAHYREFVRDAPPACTVHLDFFTAPPAPFLPAAIHGTKLLALVQCYVGDIDAGTQVLAPLRGFGQPVFDAVTARPFIEAQRFSDAAYASGWRNYWNAHNLAALDDGAMAALVECAAALPTPESDLLVMQTGGAIAKVAVDATAYPHRSAAFVACPGARWRHASDDERAIAWVRTCQATLGRHSTGGTYLNFMADGDGRQAEAYGANYARLAEVKRQYDPDNVFRNHQPIAPAG